MQAAAGTDPFVIAGETLASRLLLGTAGYPSQAILRHAVEAGRLAYLARPYAAAHPRRAVEPAARAGGDVSIRDRRSAILTDSSCAG